MPRRDRAGRRVNGLLSYLYPTLGARVRDILLTECHQGQDDVRVFRGVRHEHVLEDDEIRLLEHLRRVAQSCRGHRVVTVDPDSPQRGIA
jgi:hypothetical protein